MQIDIFINTKQVLMKTENLEKQDRWLSSILEQRVDQKLVDVRLLGSDYAQRPFETYGEVFHFKILEERAAMLINNDFIRLTEVILRS